MKFLGNFFSLLTEFCKNCVKRTFDRAKSKKKEKKEKQYRADAEVWTSKVLNFLTLGLDKIGNDACAAVVARVNSKTARDKKKKTFRATLRDCMQRVTKISIFNCICIC